MGRIIVHLHGRASDSKMNSLIEDYSVRLKSKVRLEIHNSKLSGQDYLSKLPSGAILLDEGGEMMTSVDFSIGFPLKQVNLSGYSLCSSNTLLFNIYSWVN